MAGAYIQHCCIYELRSSVGAEHGVTDIKIDALDAGGKWPLLIKMSI